MLLLVLELPYANPDRIVHETCDMIRAILIEHGFRLENRKYTQRLENARTEKERLYSFVRSKMALFSFAQKGAIYFREGLENRFSIFELKTVLDKNGP